MHPSVQHDDNYSYDDGCTAIARIFLDYHKPLFCGALDKRFTYWQPIFQNSGDGLGIQTAQQEDAIAYQYPAAA